MINVISVIVISLVIFAVTYVSFYVLVHHSWHYRSAWSVDDSANHTPDRAKDLQRESERYRNVLISQLIRSGEERRRDR